MTDNITLPRATVQQALDAWDDPMKDLIDLCVAMDALRTALEQQQAEPVAWMDREGDLYKMPEIKNWAPPHTMLYTTPPQRKQLTDELEAAFKDGWQSAKAAHGIKEGA